MPASSPRQLQEHLGLTQRQRPWLTLRDSITDIIQAHFETSLSAPVPSKQPDALKRTMDQVYRDLMEFFPRSRRSTHAILLKRFIWQRVNKLRELEKRRLKARHRQAKIHQKRTQKEKKVIVQFKTPTTDDIALGMEIRSLITKQMGGQTEHSFTPTETVQAAGIDQELPPDVIDTPIQSPPTSIPPFMEFRRQINSAKFALVPVTPSKIRAKSWIPPSQRILGLNHFLANTVQVRTISPIIGLRGDEGRSTPHRARSRSDMHTRGIHRYSPITPSRLSQRLNSSPIPPILHDDDLFTFLYQESLGHLYPYLKRDGWNMEVVQYFSYLDMEVIYLTLELISRKIPREVRLRAHNDGDIRKSSRFENAYWRMLAAKIYSLGHGGK